MNKLWKKVLVGLATFTGTVALVVTPMVAANAVEDCTPSDGIAAYDEVITEAYDEIVSAQHWQRYSWTGGPHEEDSAPAFPGEGWQANVAGDPHGIGVAGAYFKSHGNKGKGDWFYLELVPAVVVHHDAVITHHDAVPPVVCEPDPEPALEIGGYCYELLNAENPAAWENSGLQTFAAKKAGIEDWTTAEKFALCGLASESCDPVSIGFQSDWTSTEEGFEFPEHIQYPYDNIGWPPIYKANHTKLTQTVPEEGCEEVIPLTISFDVPTVQAQCGVDGQLPTLPEVPTGATRSVSPEGTGPGTYTATYAAILGYIITGQSVFEIEIPEALAYQSADPEAPCYVEPKDDVVTYVDGEAKCGEASFERTTTTISYLLNTVTGELEEQEPVVTKSTVPVTVVPCQTIIPKLGTDPLVPGLISGAVLLLGVAGLLYRRFKTV